MHSLALPAASAAPALAASPRRSLRSNFGVPYGLPSDSCDSVNGLAVDDDDDDDLLIPIISNQKDDERTTTPD